MQVNLEVNPADIRFTQDSISLYFQYPHDDFSVRKAVRKLSKDKMRPDDFPTIRVNSYGGCLWSIDNRRLWVFRLARCSSIEVKLVNEIHPRLKNVLSNGDLYSMMRVEDFFPRVRDKGQKDYKFDRRFPQPVPSLRQPVHEALEMPPINTAHCELHALHDVRRGLFPRARDRGLVGMDSNFHFPQPRSRPSLSVIRFNSGRTPIATYDEAKPPPMSVERKIVRPSLSVIRFNSGRTPMATYEEAKPPMSVEREIVWCIVFILAFFICFIARLILLGQRVCTTVWDLIDYLGQVSTVLILAFFICFTARLILLGQIVCTTVWDLIDYLGQVLFKKR